MSPTRGAAAPARPLFRDDAPHTDVFRADVIAGLTSAQKTLPCKYLYDDAGAALFDRICELDAYYPTRTETSILRQHGADIADMLGPHCRIVEFGSGSALKTERLLARLHDCAAYVPVDISRAQLLATVQRLAQRFPELDVVPVCGDYTRDVTLPEPAGTVRTTVVFFPGSTIGNFEPGDAVAFLERIAHLVGAGGAALIGFDLQKDRATLERAYDDPEGVTAAFNLNLLVRINRELGAGFDVARFHHRAFYNSTAGRIEMHIVSACDQIVQLPDAAGKPLAIALRRGEAIVTEHSYKYTVPGIERLAADAGLYVARVWTDPRERFALALLRETGATAGHSLTAQPPADRPQ